MKKRLLVVDDNKGVRLLLKEILRAEGYEVLDAQNGREALNYAADYHLSLVLLDIKMPGLSGIDVLNQLKHLNPDLPVILISAYSEMDLLNKALELHPKALFMSKPFDLENVRKLVRNMLTFSLEKNKSETI